MDKKERLGGKKRIKLCEKTVREKNVGFGCFKILRKVGGKRLLGRKAVIFVESKCSLFCMPYVVIRLVSTAYVYFCAFN